MQNKVKKGLSMAYRELDNRVQLLEPERDDVAACYDISGQGDPTLVFIHGWGCDRSYWRNQAQHFSTQYRVVTIDLPGHGESANLVGEWTVSTLAKQVCSLVKRLQLDAVIFVGHSTAEGIILAAAASMPERVLGI